jgi:glycosyltransferase involved in cell wall biosynthesis
MMKPVMRISVIIPVYNREEYIRRAIDSVLNQTRPADEIIVVDDGSTDATPSILADYGELIQVVRQENTGVSSARNRGIRVSSGNWIALLDSDDEWFPDKLALQESWLKKNPSYRICQTQEIWIRRGKRVNPMKKHTKVQGDIFFPSLKRCLVSPSAVLFERQLFEENGGFDESFPVCEDYDLWLRISLHEPVGLLHEAGIIKYGGHTDQLSRSVWGMDRFRVFSLEKILSENPDLSWDKKVAVLRELIYKLTVLHHGALKRNSEENAWKKKLEKYNFLLQQL